MRAGREQDYHGIAIHPHHLSLYETLVLRRQRYYDPELDRQSKIKEFRAKFEESLSAESHSYDELRDFDHQISENVHRFFQNERQKARGLNQEIAIVGQVWLDRLWFTQLILL